MATVWLEPGGDATYGVDLFDANNGTPAVATDFVHGSHIKSIKYPAGSANNHGKKGILGTSGRASFWIYINALPSATCSFFDALTTGFGTGVLVFRLNTSGQLQLFSSGVQLGSTGSTIPTAGFHRLSFAWTVTSTTVYTVNAWLDGVSALSVSNTGTLAGTAITDALFGNVSGDTTMDIRLSDFYFDNSSALTDPGNIWVTAKRPLANGGTNNFATNGSASGYGSGNAAYVNERPINTSDFVSITPTAVKSEEYAIEGQSVGDINISGATIVDFMGWIDAKVASTSNSPVMNIILSTVRFAKTLTTSNAIYFAILGSTTWPNGTQDIGMSAQYTTTGHLVTLNECGVVVAYIPASGGPVAGGSMFMVM